MQLCILTLFNIFYEYTYNIENKYRYELSLRNTGHELYTGNDEPYSKIIKEHEDEISHLKSILENLRNGRTS